MPRSALLGAAALAAALCACAQSSPRRQNVLTRAQARAAYAVGERLAAQDRARSAERRAATARVIGASVTRVHEAGRTIALLLHVRNKTIKTIRSFVAGVEVWDAAGKRIGLTEIRVQQRIAPHGARSFWYPLRYLRFGEDAGTMRLAARKRKRIALQVVAVTYTDGTRVGPGDYRARRRVSLRPRQR